MKQSDLEYLGKIDGRHSWSLGKSAFIGLTEPTL